MEQEGPRGAKEARAEMVRSTWEYVQCVYYTSKKIRFQREKY